MKTPSVPNLGLLLCMIACFGLLSVWPSTSATAEKICADGRKSTSDAGNHHASGESCAKPDDSFSLMLPFVLGNDSDGGSLQPQNPTAVPSPGPTAAIRPTLPPTPTETADPQSTPTPSATTSPTTTLPPTSTPATPSSPGAVLFDPPTISALSQDGDSLSLSWAGCEDARDFRVLYGRVGDRPDAMNTTEREINISNMTSMSSAGQYSFTVECYDHLGNSIFGSPRLMEVIQ